MKKLFEGQGDLLKQLKLQAGLVSDNVNAPKVGVKVVGKIDLSKVRG